MVVKYDDKNLGELVHRSKYDFVFTPEMTVLGSSLIDGNNHVGSGVYLALSEKIRTEQFLPNHGFSDKWFNEHGCKMVRGLAVVDFKRGIEGSKVDIALEVYIEKAFFHLLYHLYNSDGGLAAKIIGNEVFKEKRDDSRWYICKEVPKFFVEAIRNV